MGGDKTPLESPFHHHFYLSFTISPLKNSLNHQSPLLRCLGWKFLQIGGKPSIWQYFSPFWQKVDILNVNHQIVKLIWPKSPTFYCQNHQIATLFWGKSPSPHYFRITKSTRFLGLNRQLFLASITSHQKDL